jgi:hypothetical protein
MARRQNDIRNTERFLGEQFGGTWVGWTAENSALGIEMYAQYRQADTGRWVVTGLLLTGGVALTADQLRRVPMVELENAMNLSESDAMERLAREKAALPDLQREGMAPEDFSKLVAAHYEMWARYVPHPAGAMAAEYGVKAPTIHTWIREARLRGFLPPAHRGKAKPAPPPRQRRTRAKSEGQQP